MGGLKSTRSTLRCRRLIQVPMHRPGVTEITRTRPLQMMKILSTMCNKNDPPVQCLECTSQYKDISLTTRTFESRNTGFEPQNTRWQFPIQCFGSKFVDLSVDFRGRKQQTTSKAISSPWKELQSSQSRPLAPASRHDLNLFVCTDI